MSSRHFPAVFGSLLGLILLVHPAAANSNVYVSRFWHNHQPIYWPEWNSNGSQTSRVQYAWDSIVLKPGQNYGGLSPANHPENNLTDIFGLDDRRNAYQAGPRNSLANVNSNGGFALSYSGSLIDNVRQLGAANQLGYGSNWWNGNREARGWHTPAGARRLDLVGFTYHHSLAPLLPKSVFRKELQIFKQAWWKAWNGNSDLSDHSKGFFPTEMAYSRHLIDVLVDEGYEWVIVASHHISRTSPSYNTKANPEASYNIYSSPPNKADQIGPVITNGWWYSEPNPGNAAWNVSPYAYQLHRVKYVNPETGAEKSMVAVPSDDVLSYRYGYANEGTGKIGSFISPFANDPTRPVIVMPATDGDNAWGGGSSSWMEATPQLFSESASAGYKPSTPQDFVNAHGAAAPMAHIEDGAWIFPEMDYGSPYFLKWIEPPVSTVANRGITTYPGTQIDMETPGFALKFYSYAPLMAGANWCETAEQILRDEGGSVEAWKIQAPYDWNGTWTAPNDVELAWHIYLKGLDSGFNYYGGLGNDDEVKPGLATRRAIEKLQPWMTQTRRDNDRTPPTVLKPQRFPYNPGGYTFGWFNSIPGGNTSFLKKMPSEFYIWTHAYDLSGVTGVTAKVRIDNDGVNPLASNQNETYAGGSEVGTWISIPMTKRELPKTREALNAAAANGQIDYFLPTNEVADYYFAKITSGNVPGFRGKLLDYYIEAVDAKGNVHKSDIQQVFVEDDGQVPTPPSQVTGVGAEGISLSTIRVSWPMAAGATTYKVFRNGNQVGSTGNLSYDDNGLSADTEYTYTIVSSNSAGDASPSSGVTGRTLAFIDVNPMALLVTGPSGATTVASDTTSYTFTGQAGSSLSNGIVWTNPLTGQGGSFAWARDWTVNVPLGGGSNNVTFSANYLIAGEQTNASDSPVNASYAGGWTNGSTGGSGFGAWTLTSTSNSGHFLAGNSSSNMSTGLTNGFGLWANGGGVSTARRSFNTPLAVGSKFKLRFDNNWIDNGSSAGFALADASNSNRFAFYFVGGETFYRVSDATNARQTAIHYTSEGLDAVFELTASNAYKLSVGTNIFTGTLGAGGAISQLVASNNSAGTNTPYNVYLGAMSLTIPVNDSGTVTTNAPTVTRTAGGMTDGIPNEWWESHFPNPADWVAANDPDGDGFTSAEEHALGTDPSQPAARFQVRQTANEDGTVTITWSSVAGKKYRLQARPSLSEGSWADVGGDITASGPTSSTTHSANGQHFYRVRLVP